MIGPGKSRDKPGSGFTMGKHSLVIQCPQFPFPLKPSCTHQTA